jgi:MATE family multidrug resistance protein
MSSEYSGVPFIKKQLRKIAFLSGPVIIAEFSRLGMGVTDNIFLGHIGKNEIAGAMLGASYSYCSLYFGIGLIFALDTLVSQAFGAKSYRVIGTYTQTALLVVTISAIPIGLAWWFTEPILIFFKQPPEISHYSGMFLQWSLPGLLPLLWWRTIGRFLTNQGIMWPGMVMGLVAFALNIFFNWLFIYGFELGFIGSPIATSVSRVILPIFLWAFVVFRGYHKKTCFGFHRESIQWPTVREFLKLAFASVGMLWFEVIAGEAITLMIGYFDRPENLAGHAIVYSTLGVSFILPNSWSIGSQTRIGNLVGAGKAMKARAVTFITLIFAITWMLSHAAIMFFFPEQLVSVYTTDQDVMDVAKVLMRIGALCTIVDAAQTMLGGILRGIGKPTPGTIVQFLAYYVIAIPVGAFVSFYLKWGDGLYGFWWALILGLFLASCGNAIFIWRADWEKITTDALKLVGSNPDKLEQEKFLDGLDDDIELDIDVPEIELEN